MSRITVDKDTQFAVLGLGKFGLGIASSLYDNGYTVLGCDLKESVVQAASECTTHTLQADAADKATLERIGIRNFDVVIIAFSFDFEAAAVTATILKELQIPYILAKANGARQKQILESIGVDRVILPEKEMGEWVAYNLITNDIQELIYRSEKYDIVEMKPRGAWVGKTLSRLRLRQTESLNIIAIVRSNELVAMLDGNTELREDDLLIALAFRE